MSVKAVMLVAPLLGMWIEAGVADGPLQLGSENDRINYSVGYQMGGDFKRQNVEVDANMLIQGIEDAIGRKKPLMDEQTRFATLSDLAQRVKAEEKQRRQQQALASSRAGEAFLASNAGKAGVKTLESGLQYRVIQAGNGVTPGPGDRVTVHYRGTLVDGTEFDSSYRRNQPATFVVNQTIPGWREALQLMKEGDRWELVVPSQLAYGERGAGARVPPDSTLIFEVELISVN